MEVRNEEMVPFGELSYKEQRLLEERYEHGEVEYFNHGIKKWYLKIDPVCHSSSVYRTKPKKEEQQMKETQPYNENSFPWYMVDSKWNAVARDSDYTSWTLYEEKPGYNGTDGLWYSNTFNGFTSLTETAQRVIGVDMSRWNDVPWEESLMLRPGYQEKEEESNCDEVTSKEEADHSVNSVKEYPVVKMKELRNYTIGDVVRLKKNGKLVEITVWERSEDCYCCALYKVFGCYGKTKCSNFPGDVCFHEVEEE